MKSLAKSFGCQHSTECCSIYLATIIYTVSSGICGVGGHCEIVVAGKLL